ncbi:MAG: homoserine O-acetyltransferase [Candidatus Sumerlaeia bacterium]|nr:homoserine O-acetyltransferase [Candidatus Sumerlaeia bacterium]
MPTLSQSKPALRTGAPRAAAEPAPLSRTRFLDIAAPSRPFRFRDGGALESLTLAYETHGTLSPQRDNAILLFHALSGSHHTAGHDPVGPANRFWTAECHEGWWDDFIGPGRALDTSRYFVICANYPGGCYGSTGPSSIDPESGEPYGSRFPALAVEDIVDANARLLDELGIDALHAVVGASLGGCCAVDFALRHSRRAQLVVPIATGLRATSLAKAHNLEQILAIESDPEFRGGDYYGGPGPERGLALARMISHKTFVSLSLMERRARGEIVEAGDRLARYRLRHPIESYLLHQGKKFTPRFDANTYLRILDAWQSWDVPSRAGCGGLPALFAPCAHQSWLLFSISSDVCFYPEEQAEIASALRSAGVPHEHITVNSEKGHDSFLLEPSLYAPYLGYKLRSAPLFADHGDGI